MGLLVELLADDAGDRPAPDLALVEELVGRAAGSGLDVTPALEGDRDGPRPRSPRRSRTAWCRRG